MRRYVAFAAPRLLTVLSREDDLSHISDRAAKLAEQMLAYSGKGQFIVEPTDISEVVEGLAGLLEAAIGKGGLGDLDDAVSVAEGFAVSNEKDRHRWRSVARLGTSEPASRGVRRIESPSERRRTARKAKDELHVLRQEIKKAKSELSSATVELENARDSLDELPKKTSSVDGLSNKPESKISGNDTSHNNNRIAPKTVESTSITKNGGTQ